MNMEAQNKETLKKQITKAIAIHKIVERESCMENGEIRRWRSESFTLKWEKWVTSEVDGIVWFIQYIFVTQITK